MKRLPMLLEAASLLVLLLRSLLAAGKVVDVDGWDWVRVGLERVCVWVHLEVASALFCRKVTARIIKVIIMSESSSPSASPKAIIAPAIAVSAVVVPVVILLPVPAGRSPPRAVVVLWRPRPPPRISAAASTPAALSVGHLL